MATAWISVIGSAVTAIAAFGGVLLAQRATRVRDLDSRVWESRSRAYEDLMRWILAISHAIDGLTPADDASGQPPQLSDDQARALQPAPDLEARVTAYASADILRDFRQCRRLLASPYGRRDIAGEVAWAARSLGDDIREELRTGRELQEPVAFRLLDQWEILRSILAPGRRHAPRGHRLLEQEDGTGFTWSSDVHGTTDAQPTTLPPDQGTASD
jgi:hypothetical protein